MDKIELENSDFRKKHISVFMAICLLVLLGIVVGALLEWWPDSTIFVGLIVGIAIAIRGAALGLWCWSDIWHSRNDGRNSS